MVSRAIAAANDSMTSTPGTVPGAASASWRAVTARPVRARTVSTTHRDGSSTRWPTGSARDQLSVTEPRAAASAAR